MWMEIFLGFVALFLALYFYVTKNFNRYKELGFPYEKGVFPFGSYDFIFGGHFDIQTEKIHKKFENEKYFGHFMFGKPMVGINDPDILKMIQVKDFDHFVDDVNDKLKPPGNWPWYTQSFYIRWWLRTRCARLT